MNTPEKVIKQVSYYFSDSNILRDKFMKSKIKENDGWIELDCLLTFNRLRQLCNDKEQLLQYLENANDNFLEVSREKMAVRRQHQYPIPDITAREFYDSVKQKTVILKGFPANDSITIDIIEKFIIDNNISNVVDIRLMRNASKHFIGKIYVQLLSEEIAKQFLESKEQLKFIFEDNEHEITKLTVDENREKYKKKKEEKARENFYDQIGYQEGDKPGKGGFQPGKLIHFSCSYNSITREHIKDTLKNTFPIRWIHFNKGDPEGIIELEKGGDAIKLYQHYLNDQGVCELIIKPNDEDSESMQLKLKVIEGQDEITFWRSKLTSKKKKQSSGLVSKRRMRNHPENVTPQGKHTKFSDAEANSE